MPSEKAVKNRKSDESRVPTIVVVTLLVFFVILYCVAYFVPQLRLVESLPDVIFYIWLNMTLAVLWWGHKGKVVEKLELLSLGQSTMGGTVQAGIIATSIFIPLCLTAIQIMVGNNYSAIPASVKLPAANLIVAIFWFGCSTIFGVTTLVYMNQKIGENRDVLNERLIGIPTNLQFYAIVMGTVRVLYVLVLMWVGMGLALA